MICCIAAAAAVWRDPRPATTLAAMANATGPRTGPRPLALHLGAALLAAGGARFAWPAVGSGLFPWAPAAFEDAARLREALAPASADDFDAALDGEARRRTDEFLTGIESYRGHGYTRDVADPPALWGDGTTRLLDYGAIEGADPTGRVILVVPSLVNRAYVLDLAAESSLLRFLARQGLRPLLVDWRAPGEEERRFTLTNYVAGRLGGALAAANEIADGPVPVVGYCMGGLLALALALQRPGEVSAFAALATPWDFHADYGGPPPLLALLAPHVAASLDLLGEMPVDMLQSLFFSLDPMQGWVKFRRFARMQENTADAKRFVALEDWANDGVPLAGPVAHECLFGWYVDNSPASGDWRIAGDVVDPAALDMPALVVVPERDRIVPPAGARALAEAIPGAKRITPPSGHVGMVVGGRAEEALWRPLAAWLIDAGRR